MVVVLYVAGLILLHEAGGFILALYSSFIVEHRYGLSNERFTAWLWDQAKALSLGLVLGAAAASLIYVFIRWSPGRWWLPAGAVFSLIIVGLANVAPVLLLPLFYRVKPLDREALRTRLMALAERSRARVIGRMSGDSPTRRRRPTPRSQAWAGRGGSWSPTRCWPATPTRRSRSCSRTSSRTTCTATSGRESSSRAGWCSSGFPRRSDAGRVSRSARTGGRRRSRRTAAAPRGRRRVGRDAGHVRPVSDLRAQRRSVALELTRNPGAFVSTMRRLAAQNLAEERPSRLIQWLFYSHPPVAERIAAAQASSGR